jgi:hypothetical protein
VKELGLGRDSDSLLNAAARLQLFKVRHPIKFSAGRRQGRCALSAVSCLSADDISPNIPSITKHPQRVICEPPRTVSSFHSHLQPCCGMPSTLAASDCASRVELWIQRYDMLVHFMAACLVWGSPRNPLRHRICPLSHSAYRAAVPPFIAPC